MSDALGITGSDVPSIGFSFGDDKCKMFDEAPVLFSGQKGDSAFENRSISQDYFTLSKLWIAPNARIICVESRCFFLFAKIGRDAF